MMKSPSIIAVSWLALFILGQHRLPACCGEQTLLWTQTSSLWSSIHGVHGDLTKYGSPQNTFQSYTRVRSQSSKHANRIGVTYDPVQDLICWSDDYLKAVYCQPRQEMLNLTFDSQRTVLSDAIHVRDIAVDWLTGNLYLANGRSILVTPSRGRVRDIYKHLIWQDLRTVSGIAVDSTSNKLCWTDTDRGVVECSTLLGANRTKLTTQVHPVGITLVPDTRMIYWVDDGSKQIKGCDYACKNIKTYATKSTEASLYGIAVSPNMVFVTDTSQLTVDVYEKQNDQFSLKTNKEIDAVPHQITLITQRTDQPSHSCASKQCQHICLNEGDNKGRCTCKTGFWLGGDNVSCQERDLMFIHTTGSQVVLSELSYNKTDPQTLNRKRTALTDNGSDIRPLGYHFRNRLVYFGDVSRRALYRGMVTSSLSDVVEHTVNADVHGISVDWLSDNIYWTDKKLGRVMMSHISGRYHKLIITDVGKPTGLAVDSLNRLLFWNDATDGSKKIRKSDLTGSGLTTVTTRSTLDDPQGVAVDPHNKRIYWVDTWQAAVYSIPYDGGDRKVILKSQSNERYYDIAVFQDMMSWTDQDKGIQFGSLLSGDRYNMDNLDTRSAYDVIAFDGYLQPEEDHPCKINNGGCDQLCILMSGGQHSCECAIGFKLNSDWITCSSNTTEEYFVLYTDPYHKQIYQTSLNDTGRSTQGVPGIEAHRPITVDYDSGKQRYFWFDQQRRQFWRSDGKSGKAIMGVDKDSSPQRMVMDPVNGWIYYTDSGRSTISKMTVDGSKHDDLLTNVTKPFDIDLDWDRKLLIWSTLNSIEMLNMTGNQRQEIDMGLVQGGGVSILMADQALYYSDNDTGTIYAYNMTTKQRRVVYENATCKIHAIAVSEQHIYFTAYNDIGVYRIRRKTGDSLTHLGELVFARVTDIKVILNKVEPNYREGFNWIILAAVLGALLLLVILLAAILGSRGSRQKPKDNPEVGSGTGTGFDMGSTDADVDHTYTYMNQSHLFDLRSSHDVMNGGKQNGDALGSGLANGSGITQRPDLINDGSFNNGGAEVHNGQVHNGQVHNGQVHNGQIGPAAVGAAEGAVVAGAATSRRAYTQEEIDAINQRYKPKKTWGRRKKTLPRDPEFEFAGDKVATRIQRLANRLRNRLSSVRWSSGERQEEGERAEPVPDQGQDTETVDPNRSGQQLPKAQRLNGPPIRYEMPRGFAPASHSTPQHIKGT